MGYCVLIWRTQAQNNNHLIRHCVLLKFCYYVLL
nr:MAG TPA: hypothetical protein [Caudoviricetes sp.]